jgi:hypothetical protein
MAAVAHLQQPAIANGFCPARAFIQLLQCWYDCCKAADDHGHLVGVYRAAVCSTAQNGGQSNVTSTITCTSMMIAASKGFCIFAVFLEIAVQVSHPVHYIEDYGADDHLQSPV